MGIHFFHLPLYFTQWLVHQKPVCRSTTVNIIKQHMKTGISCLTINQKVETITLFTTEMNSFSLCQISINNLASPVDFVIHQLLLHISKD